MLEPLRVEEALEDADWVMAMEEELNNFTWNEVWSLVECPKQNVIGTKWVFRNKQDENGVVTNNKAGLNFGETYGKGVHSSRRLGLRKNLCTGGKA
jgi:sugar/nucleoside kinase (ribokinase family)